MKKFLSVSLVLVALVLGSACEKDNDIQTNDSCNSLPHNAAPAQLVGNWANGYTSFTQVVDAYDGRFLGTTWASAKFFKITSDGRNAEFYYSAQSQYSKSSTKATGTINFEPGSTSQEGSFTFHACGAHYKGWGTTSVDRDATSDELRNNLTSRYFYKIEGQWLRIEPKGPVGTYSSSFRLVN
jgi:hypothetical protein